MDQKLDLLRRVPLFAGLGARELEEVGRLTDTVDLPAGRELTHEGGYGNEFFVIVDGSVDIERDGRRLTTLGPGDFLGEIALIDGGRRTATARTASTARILMLGHREFHSLLDRFPKIQLAVLQALAERVRRNEPDATH
jgi:CRP/FNR family transcriptional regulator, cyclic AMP receptor protein